MATNDITAILPTETLHEIASAIDSPRDVLAFGLSSKVMLSVAVPHHLAFRLLRTRLRPSASLWKSIARREDLAATEIRTLEILPGNPIHLAGIRPAFPSWVMSNDERLPDRFKSASDSKYESLTPENIEVVEADMIIAIKKMTNLTRFAWCHGSLPTIQGENDIWSTLRDLGTVKNLEVFDLDLDSQHSSERPYIARSPSFLRLEGLTSLSIHTGACNAETTSPDITELSNALIHNFPGLEHFTLHIYLSGHIDTAPSNPLLTTANWPHLRTFRITNGVWCNSTALVKFFETHPNITHLALAPMMVGPRWDREYQGPQAREIPLPSRNLLPSLKKLECSSSQAVWLFEHGIGTNVEELEGIEVLPRLISSDYFSFWWDDDEEIDEEEEEEDDNKERDSPWRQRLLAVLPKISSIKKLGLATLGSPEELELLGKIAPQLTHLKLHGVDTNPEVLDQYLPHFTAFPQLETLQAPGFFARVMPAWGEVYHSVEGNREIVRKFATVLPSLKRIIFSRDKMLLSRDEDGNVVYVVRAVGDEEGPVRQGEKV